MRSWKFAAVAAMAALVVACATSNTGSAPRQTRDFPSKIADAATWDDEELAEYVAELSENQLNEACREMRTIRTQMGCVRTAIYQGFDTTGQAREKCDAIRELEDFFECVVLGSMMYDLIGRAAPDRLAEFDWRAPDRKLEGMGEGLQRSIVDDCLEGDLADVDGCFLDRITDIFALSPDQARLCSDLPGTDDAANCLLRVYFVAHFETALRRMGQGSGRSA